MANLIKIKRSATAGAAPSSLAPGEMAANIPDKKLWIGDSSNTPRLILSAADVFNVKCYGAAGNGTTDDTSAIQAALTAIQSAGAGILRLPAGAYKTTAALTYTGNNLTIEGDGVGATRILPFSTTDDVFTLTNANFAEICGFGVYPQTVPTGGKAFNFSGSGGSCFLHHLACDGAFDIVDVATYVQMYIEQFQFNNFYGSGIVLGPTFAGQAYISNGRMGVPGNRGSVTSRGLYIKNGDTFHVNNVDITAVWNPVVIQSPSGKFVRNAFFANVTADGVGRTAGGDGWLIDGQAGEVSRVFLTNCWGGTCIGNGLNAAGANVLSLHNFIGITNGLAGIRLAGNPTTVQTEIVGCTLTGNSAAASGVYSGIEAANYVADFSIIGCKSGPTLTTPNTQKYGIDLQGANMDHFVVANNRLFGNVTGSLHNLATGSNTSVVNNLLT